jgi:hypothetical protein
MLQLQLLLLLLLQLLLLRVLNLLLRVLQLLLRMWLVLLPVLRLLLHPLLLLRLLLLLLAVPHRCVGRCSCCCGGCVRGRTWRGLRLELGWLRLRGGGRSGRLRLRRLLPRGGILHQLGGLHLGRGLVLRVCSLLRLRRRAV